MEEWTTTHRVDDQTLKELLQLDKNAFAGKDIGNFEQCKKWLAVNKHIYTVLKFKGQVVGYINFTPLTDKAFEEYRDGKIKDYQLTEKDIRPFVRGGDLNCLFMSIVIKEEFRDGIAIVKLLNAFSAFLESQKAKGVNIASVLQDCVSVDGIKIALNFWGAKYVRESRNGKIYVRSLHEKRTIFPTKLRYEELSEKNLALASKIQYEIFKDTNSVGYLDYKKAIFPQNRLDSKVLPLDYLVYADDTPIGVVGLYEIPEYKDDIWVDWLGVLPQYRNRGYGTQMLLHIFETARKYDKKYLRLYTFEKTYAQGVRIYKKTMQRFENYFNKKDNARWMRDIGCKVFGSSLHDKRAPLWNNKFLNVKEEFVIHKKSVRALKRDKII